MERSNKTQFKKLKENFLKFVAIGNNIKRLHNDYCKSTPNNATVELGTVNCSLNGIKSSYTAPIVFASDLVNLNEQRDFANILVGGRANASDVKRCAIKTHETMMLPKATSTATNTGLDPPNRIDNNFDFVDLYEHQYLTNIVVDGRANVSNDVNNCTINTRETMMFPKATSNATTIGWCTANCVPTGIESKYTAPIVLVPDLMNSNDQRNLSNILVDGQANVPDVVKNCTIVTGGSMMLPKSNCLPSGMQNNYIELTKFGSDFVVDVSLSNVINNCTIGACGTILLPKVTSTATTIGLDPPHRIENNSEFVDLHEHRLSSKIVVDGRDNVSNVKNCTIGTRGTRMLPEATSNATTVELGTVNCSANGIERNYTAPFILGSDTMNSHEQRDLANILVDGRAKVSDVVKSWTIGASGTMILPKVNCSPNEMQNNYVELSKLGSDLLGEVIYDVGDFFDDKLVETITNFDTLGSAGMTIDVGISEYTDRQYHAESEIALTDHEDVEIIIDDEIVEKTEHDHENMSINLALALPEQEAKIVGCKPFAIKRHQGCDSKNMFVPTSDGKPKELCCMFCLVRYQKLERHLRTVHKSETEVQKFLAFKPGTKSRREVISGIRKKGEFMWNSDPKLNGGELQTSRRPNIKFKRQPWQIIACANCMGTYSSNTLRHHWRNCTNDSVIGERLVKQLGRATEGRIHPTASDDLNELFSKFRDNEGIRMIQFDWLAMCYGNELCLNYSPHYQEGYIRSKMRASANVLRLSKAISSEISDLPSLFNVKHCNTVIEVIQQMGKFDRESKHFGSPGTALTTVTLINTIGDLLITESMKLDDEIQERNAERFLKVFKRDVRTKINKLVANTIAKNRRGKKSNIPTTADVQKLSEYLDVERDAQLLELTAKYSYQTWLNLAQLTLVTIMVFNRRRAGEMRNTAISDFLNRDIIADQSDMILETISQETKQEIKSRMQIRGKLNRTVPVLLKQSWEDCIDVLIRYRKNVGLPENNDFLFALPTQSWKVKTINVWAAINSYAVACGAQNPSSLKGTNLRKHFASYAATKKLHDRDLTNMADFMGHDERIHLKIYRQNPLASQLSLLTPLLNKAQGKSIQRTGRTKTVRKKPARVVSSSDDDSDESDSCNEDLYESDSCNDDIDGSDSCETDKKPNIVKKNQPRTLSKPRKTKTKGAPAMAVSAVTKKPKNQKQKLTKPRKTDTNGGSTVKTTRKRKSCVPPKIIKKIKKM